EKLIALREKRNNDLCNKLTQTLHDKAVSGENLMPTVLDAVANNCTLGEITDTLRDVFGEYK
ncbi:MAG TPA: methylmalonyl-CoA mutase family protein, partial [Puia sp.]|nr:methylmalonyl-CoA mutase family protein [Puia sp.]